MELFWIAVLSSSTKNVVEGKHFENMCSASKREKVNWSSASYILERDKDQNIQ